MVGTPTPQSFPAFTAGVLGEEWVALGDGVSAPRTFSVRIQTDTFSCRVEARTNDYGKPECEAINLRMLDGSKLDWRIFQRLPLTDWLADGLTLLLRMRIEDPIYGGFHERSLGMFTPSAARNELLAQLRRVHIDRAGSRRPLTLEHLEHVAGIYKAGGKRPGKALEEAFPNHKRSTIDKWVSRARKEHLLPPSNYPRTKKED